MGLVCSKSFQDFCCSIHMPHLVANTCFSMFLSWGRQLGPQISRYCPVCHRTDFPSRFLSCRMLSACDKKEMCNTLMGTQQCGTKLQVLETNNYTTILLILRHFLMLENSMATEYYLLLVARHSHGVVLRRFSLNLHNVLFDSGYIWCYIKLCFNSSVTNKQA